MSSTAIARKRAEIAPPLRLLAPSLDGQRTTPPTRIPKKPRTQVACETCKTQKTKCSGHTPVCARCQKLGIKCNYSYHILQKKRQSIRSARVFYQAQYDKYKAILDCIRGPDASLSGQLLQRLRTKQPLDEIVAFILQKGAVSPMGIMSPSSVYTNSNSMTALESNIGEISLDVVNSTNAPILLNVKPWTTVMADNELLSPLISLYLTQESNENPPFDIDIFLTALQTGDNTLCSPLLVNAILAQACDYMTRVPNDEPNPAHDFNYLGHLFLQHALHLWHEESNATSPPITTAQAGLVLVRIMRQYGLDATTKVIMSSTFAILDKLQNADVNIQSSMAIMRQAAFVNQG
ncbi:hypothetical protein TWF694_006093 [Orbilia ellipsospora]|uniref:Zn(2)-C6 fungal-type domain-containing protein n=1 Tax=Orbilia ellipsospora TaxID=2528407 RepID=A0AAV9WR82_9PEZI